MISEKFDQDSVQLLAIAKLVVEFIGLAKLVNFAIVMLNQEQKQKQEQGLVIKFVKDPIEEKKIPIAELKLIEITLAIVIRIMDQFRINLFAGLIFKMVGKAPCNKMTHLVE